MTRIIAVTLLLIMLVDSFCQSKVTDEFYSAGFTAKDIRKCRCKQSSRWKLKCPINLIPTDDKGRENLKNCLCSQPSKHCLKKFKVLCKRTCAIPVGPF